MITYGLRSKIALNLLILLMAGMILLSFVILASVERVLIRKEVSRGELFISGLEMMSISDKTIRDNIVFSIPRDKFNRFIRTSGYSCALMIDYHQNQLYCGGIEWLCGT